MRHDDKNSEKTIGMKRLLTFLFIISLQFEYGLSFRLQVQQTVLNSLGYFGKPDGPIKPSNDTNRGGRGCVGSICTSTCSCNFAECEFGLCVCQENFLPNSDDECVEAVVPSSCSADVDCQDSKKECFKNFCVCKPNYKFTISNLCVAVLGSLCRDDEDCAYGENMICEREMCICDFGYRENSDGSPTCVVDQSCTNETCHIQKRNSICVNDICVCPSGYTEFRGVCAVDRVRVPDDCEFSWQCSDNDPNSECKDTAKCGCIDGFELVNDVCKKTTDCSIGTECPDDACCEAITTNSYCDPTTRSCSCEDGYFEHRGVNNGSSSCQSLHLLGDPCDNDVACQTKTPDSVCFEGHCVCDDTTVEAYQCEPVTILNGALTQERFTKVMIAPGEVEVIKSKLYDTGTYPPNRVFAYSVVAPVGKVLKVTINHLVLADGTTLEFYMSPWKKIAELEGLVNSHYDDFLFTTYQNQFTVVLTSQAARAKGFQMTVEVAEPSEGACMVDYDVTGTVGSTQTIQSPGYPTRTNSPFCHIYLHPTRMSEIVHVTLDTLDTAVPPSSPAQPFNLWDSVSTKTSRLVETTALDSDTRQFMAYPNAGITLVLNNFLSTDTSNARVKFEGTVWSESSQTCGTDITVSTTSQSETFTSTDQVDLCIWKFTPTSPEEVVQITITEFTTTDGEDSVAIYSGDLVDDEIRPKLGAFDSSVTSKTFDSAAMTSNSMFILLRVADTPNLTELSFSVVVIP